MSGFSINILGFPGGSDGKESACNAGDLGLIPVSPLEKEMAKKKKKKGNGNSLQYSFSLINFILIGG